MGQYPFEFSVIAPVYNVEPFLREAVESVVRQDIGMEKIQLILVDDGSTDGSGKICDEYAGKYPGNIVVVHKENGGVSSARNRGLELAKGQYVGFLDTDDKYALNTFREVSRFFGEHADETDVVSLPVQFFEDYTGSHTLNYKFARGTRVIDLRIESNMIQLHPFVFIKAAAIGKERFDEQLAYSEDALFINRILLRKWTMGVVPEAGYYYRKRRRGEPSALQKSTGDKKFYISCIERFHEALFEYAAGEEGEIPKFIQYVSAYELQWRLKTEKIRPGVLTEAEEKEYLSRFYRQVSRLDDDVIMGQPVLSGELKLHALRMKYGREPDISESNGDIVCSYSKEAEFRYSDMVCVPEFCEIGNGICTLEGCLAKWPFMENLSARVEINGKKWKTEQIERGDTMKSLGETVIGYQGFKVTFPLSKKDRKYSIRFFAEVQDTRVEMKKLYFREFFPVGSKYSSAYYRKDGWELTRKGGALDIRRCTPASAPWKEFRFCCELWKKNALGARKAVAARTAYHLLKPFKRKQLWMLSDRTMKAGDNGEAMFRYLQAHPKKDRKVIFIQNTDSPDYKALTKIGPVVGAYSFRRKLLHLLCDMNISSHADVIQVTPFHGYHDAYRDILQHVRYIYLQHGIMQANLEDWLKRSSKNISYIVTSTEHENRLILHGNYGYTGDNIWLAGSPRFDLWYHDEKKIVTIMPTWRHNLSDRINDTGMRNVAEGFEKSRYFQFYNSLINHKRLLDAAVKYKYELQFMPHPNVQPALSSFRKNDRMTFLGTDASCGRVYAESDLLITDYSSVGFDFAYLRKPLVYCQFDADEFYSGNHIYTKESLNFDYERDGFGEVEHDLEGTVDRIIEYMETGCRLKEKYRERIDRFFAFNDQNNCRRVAEKLEEISAG